MKKLKKIVSMLAAFLAAVCLAVCACAAVTRGTAKYNGSGELKYDAGEAYVRTYYDCGTSSPFNNAKIQAQAKTTRSGAAPYLYAEIKFRKLNEEIWTIQYDENAGKYDTKKTVEVTHNPWGIDYLSPESHATASYGTILDYLLEVVE